MPYLSRATIGREGEDFAIAWLRNNGFLIHDRNWRNGRYEIDIVAEKLGELHIIEVKTRRAGGLVAPEQTITPTKAAALRRAASAYLAMHRTPYEVVFDLLAIDHFPDGSYDIRLIPDIM